MNAQEWGYRVSALWQPKDKDVSWNFSFQHYRNDSAGGVDLVNCEKLRGRPVYELGEENELILDDDGNELPIGEVGEICARGPQVMRGYWQRPRETSEVLSSDGWLHTGDVGHMDDDGFLFITDRIKDLIITSGGKNIAPQRIETAVGKDH